MKKVVNNTPIRTNMTSNDQLKRNYAPTTNLSVNKIKYQTWHAEAEK